MNSVDKAHVAAHAKRIAKMEQALDCELKRIEQKRERPYWYYPVMAMIVTLMAITEAVIWFAVHPIF